MHRLILVAVAALTLLLFAACELILTMPVAWRAYALVVALFAMGLLRFQPPRRQVRRILLFGAACSVAVTLYIVPWSSRKPFLRDLDSIRPGMTAGEVHGIMGGYMTNTGRAPGPAGASAIDGVRFFRHSNDGAFDADVGAVHLRDGRVASVEFLPD